VIGLDTNVLVRYLTLDDPILSPKATRLIERDLSAENPGFVSVVTMAETAWVLDRSYAFSNTDIAYGIERVLSADTLVVERERDVFAAMRLLEKGLADFSDALIGLLARRGGCSYTVTFDRRASRLDGFVLLR
jgi:predicted nucleic-acid-binding protein